MFLQSLNKDIADLRARIQKIGTNLMNPLETAPLDQPDLFHLHVPALKLDSGRYRVESAVKIGRYAGQMAQYE